MADREPRPGTRLRGGHRASVVGVYVLVLVVLQIFLLSVALDAFHGHDAGLAWNAAACRAIAEHVASATTAAAQRSGR